MTGDNPTTGIMLCVILLIATSLGNAAPSNQAIDAPVNAVLPAGSKELHRSGPIKGMTHGIYLDSPIPPVTLAAKTQVVQPSINAFDLDGNVAMHVGDELSLYADHVDGNFELHSLNASGDVYFSELGTMFRAESLSFNSETRTGNAVDAVYRHYPYTLHAKRLLISPNQTEADDATLTTSPPNIRPLILLKANPFIIDTTRKRIRARHVALYLSGTRVLTIPEFTTPLPSENEDKHNQGVSRQFGVDSVEGVYAGAGAFTQIANVPITASGVYSSAGKNQAVISTSYNFHPIIVRPAGENENSDVGPRSPASTIMYTIRDLSRIGKIPLPEGDPLRFHDFTAVSPMGQLFAAPLRSVNTGVSFDAAYNQRIFGAPISYLYVSKWPEANFHAEAPIGAVRPDFRSE